MKLVPVITCLTCGSHETRAVRQVLLGMFQFWVGLKDLRLFNSV